MPTVGVTLSVGMFLRYPDANREGFLFFKIIMESIFKGAGNFLCIIHIAKDLS